MSRPKIYAHGSYIGTTGFNNHTRDFFRELDKYVDLKVRNFTVGSSWSGLNDKPHEGEKYLTDLDRKLLYQQILFNREGKLEDYIIYPSESKNFDQDFNLILSETNHHIFYEKYSGPKIAYNVWESTRQPHGFFEQLLKFDEIWVPSEWQRNCTIEQGADPEKVKVVPEGVDVHTFFPEEVPLMDSYNDGRFKFLLFGRWDYRKSTKEIIETFLRTFDKDEPVDLIVSIDNMWGKDLDGFETTEDRLAHYGLTDERIKVIHFPNREDYIKYLKTGHVFVSCARSEGWNLPLIESMACGTPSIYSECSAQMEFANGKGFPVKILGEEAANKNTYARYTMSDLPGNYYEPDFEQLSEVMRYTYENYDQCKIKSVQESEIIRKDFSWERIGEIGYQKISDFMKKISSSGYTHDTNKITVSYLDGPKVSISGDYDQKYFIEFIDGDTNEIIHRDVITNNMWTSCGRKYYTKWIIKINGKVVDVFSLQNKKVLISFESKSVGDTVAWMPYVSDFKKKHNCEVYVSTFHNHWFSGLEAYNKIKFVQPGAVVNCDVVYRLGWFKNEKNKWERFDLYPNFLANQPLQKTASDILGLDYQERNYGIVFEPKERPTDKKYLVFVPESTAGCKEWPYESWEALTKMVNKDGYHVYFITNRNYNILGSTTIKNSTIIEAMNYMYHAENFVGLSSGLSWINWALGKHTIMISGFTPPDHEFQTNITRIHNEHSCNSCWANSNFTFDPSDWNWCPVWKGTDKQHICNKSISPTTVYKSIFNK